MSYDKVELQQIDSAFQNLVAELSVRMDSDRLIYISKAYNIAVKLFENERLESGKPIVLRLVETARISGVEIGLGSIITVSCFLVGVRRFSDLPIEQIEEEFGHEVASLVLEYEVKSGFTHNKLSFELESVRKMVLSMTTDVRVVFMAVAIRLYDVRNPIDIESEYIETIYDEIKYLTIPVAHRLGWYDIKAELEDRVMQHENPSMYELIKSKITQSKEVQESMMNAFIEPIRKGIAEIELEGDRNSLDCTFKWRTKSIPSIYEKMKAQNVDFEHVFDIFAIRIIINNSSAKSEIEDCWRVYSVVTNIYVPNPSRLRDWISFPKDSGYESLHTTVKNGESWVEVQIRTQRMDDIAERGTAAHWQYKSTFNKETENDWLNQVREVVEHPKDFDFDSNGASIKKQQMNKIFIICPDGEIKQLPVGSTVLDFAYEIHSEVGSICSGAKVNNRAVPIRHELHNGDKVEIITSRNQKPRADWLNYVTTEKAKNRIRRYIQKEELKYVELGEALFLRKMKNWKQKSSDDVVSYVVSELKLNNPAEFYSALYNETIDLADLKKIVLKANNEENKVEKAAKPVEKKYKKPEDSHENLIVFKDMGDVEYKIAKCCNPIHGDEIFGFLSTQGSGLTVHRVDCPNAQRLRLKFPYRVVEAKWNDGDAGSVRIVNVGIVADDTIGILGDIATVISSEMHLNMMNLSINSRRDKVIEGRIVVEIPDISVLDILFLRLKTVKGMREVYREL